MGSPEEPSRLYIIIYLIFTPVKRKRVITKPSCSELKGSRAGGRLPGGG